MRGWCFVYFVFALFLALPVASAQPSKSNLKKAEKFYLEGEAHFKIQEYQKALESYKASYLLSLDPALLFNIAQCHRQLGQYQEALKGFKTFLQEVPNPPQRPLIEKLIAECEAKISPSQPNEAETKAMKLYEEATGYYNIREFEKALAAYKESYLISLVPELLYNMAQSSRQLGRFEEAIASYKAFIRERPDSPQRADAEARIAECMAELQKIAEAASRPVEVPTTPSKTPALLYVGAAASAVVSLTMGGIFFSAKGRAAELLSADDSFFRQDEINFELQRAKTSGNLSTAFFITAAACGAGGFLLSRKNSEQAASLLLSPTSVSFTVRF